MLMCQLLGQIGLQGIGVIFKLGVRFGGRFDQQRGFILEGNNRVVILEEGELEQQQEMKVSLDMVRRIENIDFYKNDCIFYYYYYDGCNEKDRK